MAHPLTAWREANPARWAEVTEGGTVTKAAVARKVGVTWRSVHRIERFESRPSLVVAEKIAEVTEGAVTAAALLAAYTEHHAPGVAAE